jgi:hypothetical protein
MIDRHPSTTQLAGHFTRSHLPDHLAAVSKPCGDLASAMIEALPDGPELSAGLRKLLEAKDCFVRAAVEAHRVGPATFTLNGETRTMASPIVSYDEISNLANIDPGHNPTVTYRRANGPKSEGTLISGESIEIGERTAVTCIVAGRA